MKNHNQTRPLRHDSQTGPAEFENASVDPTNVASLKVWWSVGSAVHGGEGMRLPALHCGGQVPALESDPYLSPLPASGGVAQSAAGLL